MKYFNILISCIILTSCKYQLKEDVKEWNPYSTGEVLVFESSNKQTDTFLITGMGHYFKEDNEIFEVKYNFIREILGEKKHTNSENPLLMSLTLRPDSVITIGINLISHETSKNQLFERRISWLDSLVPVSLYNHENVLIIKADSFVNRQSATTKNSLRVISLFWSKSEGLIGYKTEDEKQLWILKKKYSL